MKAIEDYAHEALKKEYADYPRNAWHYDRQERMVIGALKEFAAQFNQWVSVETPPEIEGQYLVTNGMATLICPFAHGKFYHIGGATHWQHLPNPPAP